MKSSLFLLFAFLLTGCKENQNKNENSLKEEKTIQETVNPENSEKNTVSPETASNNQVMEEIKEDLDAAKKGVDEIKQLLNERNKKEDGKISLQGEKNEN